MNQRLSSELSRIKGIKDEEFGDGIDHFQKIQEMFNRLQVENKELRQHNSKLDSSLESKEKVVVHLE